MRIVYLALVVFLGFAAATCNVARGAEVDQVELPYPEVLTCFGIGWAEKVETYTAVHQGRPYVVMQIDSNKDGKKDGLLIYRIYFRGEDTFVAITPSFLVLDRDYDGYPDEAYEVGETCSGNKKISLDHLLQDYKGA